MTNLELIQKAKSLLTKVTTGEGSVLEGLKSALAGDTPRDVLLGKVMAYLEVAEDQEKASGASDHSLLLDTRDDSE